MDSVLRGAATYFFVWAVFRLAGKRSLAQITTFDAVLLLIISETTQAALLGNNNSFTNSFLLILTILGIDVALSFIKRRSRMLERIIDSAPVVIVEHGKPQLKEMREERVDLTDVLHAARERHGLKTLDEVDFAVLEQSGGISIIPKTS